jgi:hypothetical protein
MKYLMILLLSFLSVQSRAEFVDVNYVTKTVYYHPKPDLALNLQNLDEAGGVLYVSLVYRGENATKEEADLNRRYPGYQVVALVANAKGNASLEIGDVLHVTLPTRQQQMGPYINTSINLSREQTKKMLGLGSQLGSQIKVSLPSTVNYSEMQTIEKFTTDDSVCLSLHAANVKEMMLGLLRLPKPTQVHYDSTVNSLREDMLNKCFTVESAEVHSFEDLLKVHVGVKGSGQPLVGITQQSIETTKEINISPNIIVSTLN